MIQYIINKSDLHELLRVLQVLQPDEEIIMVNNVELRNPSARQVSILVDTATNKKVYAASPEHLTSKELETHHTNLATLEQILLAEYGYLRQQLKDVRSELEKRDIAHSISREGLPKDVDERLSETLRNILSGNSPNNEQPE